MPSAVEDRQLGQAVLDSVQYGSYPESEDVISAEVPPTAIPSILKLLGQAREGVKVCFLSATCLALPTLSLLTAGTHPGH